MARQKGPTDYNLHKPDNTSNMPSFMVAQQERFKKLAKT